MREDNKKQRNCSTATATRARVRQERVHRSKASGKKVAGVAAVGIRGWARSDLDGLTAWEKDGRRG